MAKLTPAQEEILKHLEEDRAVYDAIVAAAQAEFENTKANARDIWLRPTVQKADYALIPISRIMKAYGTKDYKTIRDLLPEDSDTRKRSA